MRLSIIIPFLNSREIVRRQCAFMRKQDYPDNVEVIFMDDGSDPPLVVPEDHPKNFRLIATNDFRPWTSSLARNTAAREYAQGEYLLMTDGDYIVTRAAVDRALEFTGDRLGFRREFGVIDTMGEFTQDWAYLMKYGLPIERLRAKGTRLPPHPNNFIIRASLFAEMGGYREDLIISRPYPQGEDRWFKRKLMEFVNDGKITLPPDDRRPTIYMFPNGQFCGDVDYNPYGLFHDLTRKTKNNYWYVNPKHGCKGYADENK
jgi:glycosyltransferase involved in cell wall biosynthesis